MDKNKPVLTLGVDIGGTKIDTALVDSAGKIVASHYRLLPAEKAVEQAIAGIVESVQICQGESGQKAAALGVGVAGQIDKKQGVVRRSPNLPEWLDVPLKNRLEKTLGLPVAIDNDARTITRGEWKHGAGQGCDHLVCLFVGTGIGGGVVSGGYLLEGASNTAGELGHITVVAAGRQCHCPNEGCMEAYAGGWAIAERARDIVRANPQGGDLLNSLAGGISNISALTVSQAYQQNDAVAYRLVKDTSKYLAAGVVSIINAFNPSLLVLGGSVILGIP
ncbi:MAG TPA: ROK family protein, partial [Dehalococcoidales bacterium]|nr:ROK family protein [Dehalococcoidales bacterium]